jgi:hypothetical protein
LFWQKSGNNLLHAKNNEAFVHCVPCRAIKQQEFNGIEPFNKFSIPGILCIVLKV